MLAEEAVESFSRKGLMVFFLIAANWFTIFGISREIVVYYDYQIRKVNEVFYQKVENRSGYNSSSPDDKAYRSHSEATTKLKNRSSVTLSIFWLLYGIALMAAGIISHNKVLRVGGLFLLILAILKLFVYDLWYLGTLYRIISFISLGVVLLLISFAYQKYRDKIKEVMV
jgi:hypothetical protein